MDNITIISSNNPNNPVILDLLKTNAHGGNEHISNDEKRQRIAQRQADSAYILNLIQSVEV